LVNDIRLTLAQSDHTKWKHCISKPIIDGSELKIEVRPVRVPILYKYADVIADVNSAISNIGM
jgi:hypothetical protein